MEELALVGRITIFKIIMGKFGYHKYRARRCVPTKKECRVEGFLLVRNRQDSDVLLSHTVMGDDDECSGAVQLHQSKKNLVTRLGK